MDIGKVQKFIEKISSETIQSKIDWKCAYEFKTIDPNSGSDFSGMFLSNEFHQVIFEDSYFADISHDAEIFIVFESLEFGRDNTRLRGYNVYIRDNDDNISKLHCPQEPIYQLVNSIKSYLAKKEKSLEDFIDSYLSSSDNTTQ